MKMLLVLALSILLFFPSAGAAESSSDRWLIIKVPSKPGDATWYVDSTTFKAGQSSIWVMISYAEPYKGAKSHLMNWTFDCSARTLSIPLVIKYSGDMGGGDVLETTGVPGWVRVVPNSLPEALFSVSCEEIAE